MKTKKICSKCKIEKLFSEFGRHARKDGYQSFCKLCNKKYSNKWYKKNRTKHRITVNKNKKVLREKKVKYIIEYLKLHPCVICGESDPIVLEFDHIDKKQKYMNVAHMVSDAFGLNKIIDEIKKCQVMCANCHRRKSSKENGNLRYKLCS